MVLAESPGETSYRGKDYHFEIWNGIMFPTEQTHHASLIAEFPGLRPHPVLGKWLYLPAERDDFEASAIELRSVDFVVKCSVVGFGT